MKHLLVCAATLLFITTIHAQFNFYISGGPNYSQFRIKGAGGNVDKKNHLGFQAGFGTEYYVHYGNFFLGFGAGLAQRNWEKEVTVKGDSVLKIHYKPIFVTIPIRIGWQLPFELKDNVALKIYTGVTPEIGIAGNIKQTLKYKTDAGSPTIEEDLGKRDLTFGFRSTAQNVKDLRRSNFQFNITAGLCFANTTEVNLSYNYGLPTILPEPQGKEKNKLSYVDANIKFYLFKPKINKRTQ